MIDCPIRVLSIQIVSRQGFAWTICFRVQGFFKPVLITSTYKSWFWDVGV